MIGFHRTYNFMSQVYLHQFGAITSRCLPNFHRWCIGNRVGDSLWQRRFTPGAPFSSYRALNSPNIVQRANNVLSSWRSAFSSILSLYDDLLGKSSFFECDVTEDGQTWFGPVKIPPPPCAGRAELYNRNPCCPLCPFCMNDFCEIKFQLISFSK